MKKVTIVLAFFLYASAEVAMAQLGSGDKSSSPTVTTIEIAPSGRIKYGPNPMEARDLFHLLNQKLVQAELGLRDEQLLAYKNISERMRKSIRAAVQAVREGGEGRSAIELVQAERELALEGLEEILVPAQMERLRQIAYRIELARIGFLNAIVYGHLGEHIGVYEQQESELARKIKSLEDEREAEIVKLKREYEQKILDCLTPEQREKAKAKIGEFLHYREPDAPKSLFEEIVEKQRKAIEASQ